MADERRYDDVEVERIFRAAAEERGPARHEGPAPSGEGLTLRELQAIGREVGLSPERIADAAGALDVAGGSVPHRTHFGMPLSVAYDVDLPRAPTDAEWAILVTELRETFEARGRLGGGGSLREWVNGNLHVYVEPTATGHRLRLRTLKGSAVLTSRIGIGLVAFAHVVAVLRLLDGDPASAFSMLLVYGGVGAALVASSVLRLPGWAKAREEQFRRIGARARALLTGEIEAGADAGLDEEMNG